MNRRDYGDILDKLVSVDIDLVSQQALACGWFTY